MVCLEPHDDTSKATVLVVMRTQELAGIDVAVLQVNEANLTGLPQGCAVAAEASDGVLSTRCLARGAGCVCALSNHGRQSIQKGLMRDLLLFFNALHANHVRIIGTEQVRWVHPDCGFSMLHCSVADYKDRRLVCGARSISRGWYERATRGDMLLFSNGTRAHGSPIGRVEPRINIRGRQNPKPGGNSP